LKKYLVLLMCLSFVACLEEPIENTDLATEVTEIESKGYIRGNLGTFSDIDSVNYEILTESNSVSSYAYHQDGRIMTKILLSLDSLSTEEQTILLRDRQNQQFSALGCQGEDTLGWTFDRNATNGIVVVTPRQDNWDIAYSLSWENLGEIEYQLTGSTQVVRQ
jgi:hypothetical protein